jgi:predicted DNA-binding transcriptional regulator AlpA
MAEIETKNKATPGARPGLPVDLEPLVSIDDLTAMLQCSRRLVDRLRAAGKLPAPDVMLGPRPRWRAATIRGWLDSQAPAR